ncbi:ABC transporter substrate-binding protein [Kitasatospora viridis]|uniref:L-leucine-binding protein /L-isoleucine-binding protein /L-valine-binding protein n=1 Tax=Kitasatospora viridis TaxID=281105 RepID=A0A561T6N7_9ACTN|nr:ABC transporter substrate-binding protein [Kitasatospora viridis]TWF82760.1 L-leucine-binding protein /L-isoleucine-binding protein /L-valine-binding protein [Kitasatospora viridis]
MPDTIKIAAIGPSSGPLSTYGEMLANGVDAAVRRINADGGAAGRRLECVRYDDGGEPERAVEAARRAARDGVRFVVGHTISDCALAASDAYEAAGVLLVTPGATLPELTNRGLRLVFRTIGVNSAQGGAAGQFIADRAPRAVALVHDGRAYGRSLVEAVDATLRSRGITPVRTETVRTGTTDFAPLIHELTLDKADFVFFGGYPPELGRLIRQAAQQGLTARFVAGAACDTDEVATWAGDPATPEGLLLSTPTAFDQDPANAPVVQAVRDRGGDPANPYTLPAYAAVQVIARAIEQAGSADDTARVAAAFRAGAFPTAIGDLGYQANGDLTRFPFQVYRWQYGRPKTPAGD